jgi:CubicO group peptidase (beta-lactamase class C family)
MLKLSLLVLVVTAMSPAWLYGQLRTPTAEELAEFDAWAESHLEESRIPGALFAVASRGEILALHTVGLSNAELRTPVTDSSVWEIGSVSKQFVATAALLLVEEGRLGLDDSIHRYIPELPSEWLGATVRHLLNHTSGIPDYELIRSYDVYRFRLTPDDVIEIAHSRPMDFEPGTGWFYSNTGYYLLSMIVERIEGRPLGEVLEDRIFAPLGMGQSGMTAPEDIIPHRAAGYWVDRRDRLINRAPTETSSTLGAGGLRSSVRDLVKWDEALYSTAILSEASKAAAWTSAVLPNGQDTGYGFGWRIGSEFMGEPAEVQRHGGQVAGFLTFFYRVPSSDVVILAFANRYQADGWGPAVNRFIDLYFEQAN